MKMYNCKYKGVDVLPKYDDFELDIQKLEAKEEKYLMTTQRITGMTCPECHPYSKYPRECID